MEEKSIEEISCDVMSLLMQINKKIAQLRVKEDELAEFVSKARNKEKELAYRKLDEVRQMSSYLLSAANQVNTCYNITSSTLIHERELRTLESIV